MSKKRPNPLDYMFGGPEYLKAKFDDIDEAVVSKKSKATKDIKALLVKYPVIDPAAMGMPKGWQSEPLWQ